MSSTYEPFDWAEKPFPANSPPRRSQPSTVIFEHPASKTVEDLPTTPTAASVALRKSLRHAQSVPSIRFTLKNSNAPPLPPKLVRKTTSTASLKQALTPLLTLENEEQSLYQEDVGVSQRVVKLPSPERPSMARGRRKDVRQIFASQEVRPQLANKRVATFSSFVASQPASKPRTLSAKQSLQQLLAQNPDKTKVLPFNVGLVLPKGGFSSFREASSDSGSPISPVPTIRIEHFD